jgi:hypothetical protein
LLVNLNRINLNQSGRARVRVIAKWLVAVNVKEKSPVTLLIIITIKILMNNKMFDFFVFRRVPNSLIIDLMIDL